MAKSAKSAGLAIGRLDSLEGTVEYIDNRQNRLVIGTVPDNAPRAVSDRFKRLREGDTVPVEGRFITRDRLELENFA